MVVGICRNTIQKSERKEKRNPKSRPALKCVDAFVSSIAKSNGTMPNQAKKCSPRGWKARDINTADIAIRINFSFLWPNPNFKFLSAEKYLNSRCKFLK